MKYIFFVFICLSKSLSSKEQAVSFQDDLQWEGILHQADSENKMVFIDYYATWCGPCKMMDKTVYSDYKVGDFMNKYFISAKIQFDSTGLDNVNTQRWYAESKNLSNEYKISSFPTYLFFSAGGKLVHRGTGFKNVIDLVALANSALDTNKQCYYLLDKFNRGVLKYESMPYLATTFKEFGDIKLAKAIADKYIDNYLLNRRDIFRKEFLLFVGDFLLGYNDKMMSFVFKNSGRINSVVGPGFVEGVIDRVVAREDIATNVYLKNGKPISSKPKWSRLMTLIREKYNYNYAIRNVIDAKLKYYAATNDWAELAEANVEKIDRYGLDTTGIGSLFANNMIYSVIFMHSTNKDHIKKAIRWMKRMIYLRPEQPEQIDTYANLLYKSGQVETAINWESKAVGLDPQNPDIQMNFEKMKSRIPTWVVE